MKLHIKLHNAGIIRLTAFFKN